MKDLLTPDFMFHTYEEVTPRFLKDIGVSFLLVDIDNTLAPYEQPLPDEKNLLWFETMAQENIRIAIVSNNDWERVNLFNRDLHLPAYARSGKPLKKNMLKAMAELGAERTNTAVLGDQLLTDSLAGKRLGLRSIIVPPIKDKTNWFFRFKRFLERPYIRKYKKHHPEYREK